MINRKEEQGKLISEHVLKESLNLTGRWWRGRETLPDRSMWFRITKWKMEVLGEWVW